MSGVDRTRLHAWGMRISATIPNADPVVKPCTTSSMFRTEPRQLVAAVSILVRSLGLRLKTFSNRLQMPHYPTGDGSHF